MRPTLYTNGRIITLDEKSTVAAALVTRGRRILAVGSTEDMAAAAGDGARTVDLEGKAVVPGLIDTHAHMDREGLKHIGPSLQGCRCIDDVLLRIEAAVRKAPPGKWIVTMPVGDPPYYWEGAASLREGRLPNRHELDAVSPHNPVFIRPVWGYWRHAPNPETLISAANTLALAATGINPKTPLPSPNISLEVDQKDETLSGIFVENVAMPIIELTMLDVASRFSDEERRDAIGRSMQVYNSLGTTGIYEGHGVSAEVFRAYRAYCGRELPSVRVRMVHSPSWRSIGNADPAQVVGQWAYWAAGLGNEMLSMAGLFLDHRVNPDNAIRAQVAPYTGWGGYHYDSSLALPDLKRVMLAAARADIQCVTATSLLMDTMIEVDRVVPLAGRRWIVQHFGPMSEAHCEAAARMGLVLTPLTSRYLYKEGYHDKKIPQADFVPFKRLARLGVPVTLSTDNAPPSLFEAIWHTVARRDRFNDDVPPAAEKLSPLDALKCATVNGAYATFEERDRGTLEPDKLADFAVLTSDPLSCPEDELRTIRSLMTIVDGRTVHQDESVTGCGTSP